MKSTCFVHGPVWVSFWNWFRHIQIHNEPNLEWVNTCTNCTWWGKYFTWTEPYDARRYKAINAWYTNVYYEVQNRMNNDPDPNVRAMLAQITLWTPSMLSLYSDINDYEINPGYVVHVNYYEYLQQMIRNYRRFSYHIYPNPSDDAVNGILQHNQWSRFPSSWLQQWITNLTIGGGYDFASQITEFGWDGNTMKRCQYTQNSLWGQDPPQTCPTRDGYMHAFENDIVGFMNNQRHNAESVTVWITSGWLDSNNGNSGVDRAGGINSDGSYKRWFDAYRNQYYP